MTAPSLLLLMLSQIRLAHWQTTSYAAHKALGDAYDALDELSDQFIETYMGSKELVVEIGDETEGPRDIDLPELQKFLVNCTSLLADAKEQFDLSETDTDLLNIRDEMIGTINKLRYLLTLS